jgi:protein TonB
MFQNLIESDLHTKEIKRKGSFFLATLGAYALLLMCAGVASVYAYDARIEDQSLELVVTMLPVPPEEERPVAPKLRSNTAPQAGTMSTKQSPPPMRAVLSDLSVDPNKAGDKIIAVTNQPLPTPPGARIGPNYNPPGFNPFGQPSGDGTNPSGTNNGGSGKSAENVPPEPPEPTPKPPKQQRVVSLGAINSKALSMPIPPYPPLARAAQISGVVAVQILLDESGRVISAQATDGPVLLRQAAEKAAYQARFTPTKLSDQPVKASGVITYNFVLR